MENQETEIICDILQTVGYKLMGFKVMLHVNKGNEMWVQTYVAL